MADEGDLSRAWDLLHDGESPLELRVLRRGGPPAVGRFLRRDAFVRAAAASDRAEVTGVYATINPLRPDAPWDGPLDRLRLGGRAARDEDILARRWLLIDLDPDRPAGTNATDAELEAALALAGRIRDALAIWDWPDPVRAASGNGAHLLYRVDLPADAASADLVRRVLRGIAARIRGPGAKVDESVWNAGRVSKVYGTTARKGPNAPDRPWRPARILAIPDRILVVPADRLRAVAAWADDRGARRGDGPQPRPAFARTLDDLLAWLAAHGVAIRGTKPAEGGGAKILIACPWQAEHSTSNDSETMVWWSGDGAVGFRCLHDHCADRHWAAFRAEVEGRPGRRARAGRR
ncbi:DNA primase [Candidatus Hydrogenisulfobacillus filiaventi]|uniref:DNA primase n=1 Tax=Candidatus Hydrogenisulfobacillus filiaventi TaxID=2707344 RepID=A0A6F8ZHV9_9FIRM|nr:DNA primase [Candidatus Hydrogenisulfobacillus filiaventi]